MKKIFTILLVLVVLVAGWFVYQKYFSKNDSLDVKENKVDHKNTTYKIGGYEVTLKNGVSEMDFDPSGSYTKIITKYFGNEVRHDFDGDGGEDVAFLVTQQTGGSGTFYYLVAALNTVGGYIGSDGVLLGDRIAPQTTEMGKGNIIVVNYADRNPGESFVTPPSVGKSLWLLLDTKTMKFGEVAKDFEGEADPGRMSLTQQSWNWISTTYSDGKVVSPVKQNVFTLTFKAPKTFSAKTDCNGVGGEYSVNGDKITFEKMMSTLMFCEGSQESDFSKGLGLVESYHFTSKGELIFDLKEDGGSMIFK